MTKEDKVTMISLIPDDTIDLDKGYYHYSYVFIPFKKEDSFDRKEDQADTEVDLVEEDMEELILED